MTIDALITKVQEEKPNSFTDAKIISFINEIEVEVCEQLKIDAEDTPVYTDTTESRAKTLIAPAPYDRLYVSYVKSQIDYANEEYASYQLNAEQHVQDFADFSRWVVRTQQVPKDGFPVRFRNVF